MKETEKETKKEMTEKELDVVTTVFRNFETGLREATILPKVKFLEHTLSHRSTSLSNFIYIVSF